MKRKSLWLTLLLVILTLCVAFGVVACNKGNEEGGGGGNGEITLSQTTQEVVVGEKFTLVATTSLTGNVEWKSEDTTKVAVFNAAGKVCVFNAVAAGTTTVSASIGDKKATCAVTVITEADVERVVIKNGENAVTDKITLERGATLQLTAAGTKGTAVNDWNSSDTGVATVANGLVTAVFPGTTTITAAVNSSLKASVTVEVTAPEGSNAYKLKFAEAVGGNVFDETAGSFTGEQSVAADEFFYWGSITGWGQNVVVDKAVYDEGKISVKYSSDWDPGYWYGYQVRCENSSHEHGKIYKLTFKLDIKDMSHGEPAGPYENDSAYVTVNGYEVAVTKGVNQIEVYYKYVDSMPSFNLVMGRDLHNGTNGEFIQNVEFEISDIAWAEDTAQVTLEKPSFTIAEDGKIAITDSNAAGVASYTLGFFDSEGVSHGEVTVVNGEEVDTKTIGRGTFTVKLKANAANAHYITSDWSDTTAEMVVATDKAYDMQPSGEGGAVASSGTWTYWTSSWVPVTDHYFEDNTVVLTFANNQGNWYDTQIFYKDPANVAGKVYKYTFDVELIDSEGGRITICGNVITLEKGKHTYSVAALEVQDNASFALIMGVNGESELQEITSGTVKISNVVIEEYQPVALKAPDFSIAENVITITDPNTEGVSEYALGFFSGEETIPAYTVKVVSGEEIDLSSVLKGTYTVKLRAIAAGMLYENSPWSEKTAQITSNTASPSQNLPNGGNGTGNAGTVLDHPGVWYEWHDQNWCGSTVAVSSAVIQDGVITVEYECTAGAYGEGVQLLKHWEENVVGNKYKVTLTLKSTLALTVKVNGQEVALEAGVEKTVTINFIQPAVEQYAGAALVIAVPVEAGQKNTVVVSGVTMEELTATKLSAPTALAYNSETGVVTFTDANTAGVGSYKIGFFNAENEKVAEVTAVSGEALDTSKIKNGTYTIKVCAVAADAAYDNSDWFAPETPIEIVLASKTIAIANGEEAVAAEAPGAWIEWHDMDNWCGARVTLGEKGVQLTENTITGSYSAAEGSNCMFGVQLFYKATAAELAVYNQITIVVTFNVDHKIRVNGDDSTLVNCTANTPETITGAFKGAGASVAIVMPVLAKEDVTFTIEYTLGRSGEKVALTNGEQAGAVAAPGSWIEWHDQSWCGSTVTLGEGGISKLGDNAIVGSYSAVEGSNCMFGVQLFYKATEEELAQYDQMTITVVFNEDHKIRLNGNDEALVECKANVPTTITSAFKGAGASVEIVLPVLAEESISFLIVYTLSHTAAAA